MANVAIILLNYNSTRFTKKCIASLKATKDPEDQYHIVVWDNASTNPPKKTEFSDCEVVLSAKNLGFAQGNNQAAKYAIRKFSPDYLVFLNNDTRMTKGCIHRLLQTFNEHPDSGFIVPKIYFEKGYEFHAKDYAKNHLGKVIWYAGGGIDWKNCLPFHKGVDEVDRTQFDTNTSPLPFLRKNELSERMENAVFESEESLLFLHPHAIASSYPTEFATGCCFLTSVPMWKKSKGFDPKYFLYYEDTDLSYRVLKMKKTIYFEPRAVLYHLNAGSSSGSGSDIHVYYQTRNRLRFGLAYAPFRTKLALLREAKRMYRTGTKAVRLGILDALGGRWGNQTHRVLRKRP